MKSFSDNAPVERGALYVVATPIGNLGDITQRALEILDAVDFIAAEDTRKTLKLLTHFDIKKPLVSYYQHNLRERGEQIVSRLLNGETAAIVTDAGTPAISDPGEDLVRLCAENGLKTISVPGACAAVSALCVSGLPTGRFVFEGFVSTGKSERRKRLLEVCEETRTLIFYEAPHKLKSTLKDFYEYFGDRRLTIVRELTKINEEIIRTTLKEAQMLYNASEPRGEFVLIVEGKEKQIKDNFWGKMSIEEHFEHYISMGLTNKEAVKAVASDRNIPKNEVYIKCMKK